MSGRQILLWLVLVDFAALTVYAVIQHGYLGFFELAMANWATRLVFADLGIALSLIAVWMVRDARQRGAGFWPYLVLTLVLGSAGPLLYLIRREAAQARGLAPARSATA
jgi:Protein of unknown function DUF2834